MLSDTSGKLLRIYSSSDLFNQYICAKQISTVSEICVIVGLKKKSDTIQRHSLSKPWTCAAVDENRVVRIIDAEWVQKTRRNLLENTADD